jgi:hypothetical protein
MKLVVGISLVFAAALTAIGWFVGDKGAQFFSFYAENLRASLFSGFLTLGSFLLAVNTFMVVNLKKEVYDRAAYKDRVSAARVGNKATSFYGPLLRLSRLMFAGIAMAFVTSISQLTLGVLIDRWWSAAICLLLGAVTVIVLVYALNEVRHNLNHWFAFIEAEAEAEYAKATTPQTSVAAIGGGDAAAGSASATREP